MSKNKIFMLIGLAILILLLSFVLFFLVRANNKNNGPITNSENENFNQNIDISDSMIEDSSDQNEESIVDENNNEITSQNNSESENNNVSSGSSSINSSSNDKTNSSSNDKTNSSSNDSSNYPSVNNNTSDVKPTIVVSTLSQNVLKTSEGINLKYWLYTPENPVSNMPLIVYLHGGSARGDDLSKVVEGSFPKFLKDGELGSINAYVIMPQVSSEYRGWSDIKVSVRDLITNIKSTYGINQNKISLTGHSMGGKGTYDIALAYPNLFSCIAPMSGSITVNDTNVNKLKNLPIWAFVGTNDTIVDPSTSTNFLAEIMKYNVNSKLTTFDGATHFDVPDLGYKNTNVINWLISNSK